MDFKRLSDVEVVVEPAETANVLIEENGVIKKAPKTAVGGTGNFVMISIPYIEEMDVDASDLIEGATCNKTYDEVVEMYCTGEMDCAFIKAINSDTGSLAFLVAHEVTLLNEYGTVYISDAASAECVKFSNYDMNMSIYYYRNGLSYTSPIPQPM